MRIVMFGCGAIGSCMLPLYKKYLPNANITVIDMDAKIINTWSVSKYSHITFIHKKITKNNLFSVLDNLHIKEKITVLVDMAWYIDTIDMLKWCRKNNVNFVNTSVEEYYNSDEINAPMTGNIRKLTLYHRQKLIEKLKSTNNFTAILTHGANPGWVSHAVKMALIDMAKKYLSGNIDNLSFPKLAKKLGIRTIHISEKDSQKVKLELKDDTFYGTWSPIGFIEEALAPAEMGWGHKENVKSKILVKQSDNSYCMRSKGVDTLIKSWVPSGPYIGEMVRHEEANSICQYLTIGEYRPSVYYVYKPCDSTITSLNHVRSNGNIWPKTQILTNKDIIRGKDELGVFLISDKYGAWWTGSVLDRNKAEKDNPGYSATANQVAISVISAIKYAINHPTLGIVYPDDLDYKAIMKICMPYLRPWKSIPVEWSKYLLQDLMETPYIGLVTNSL